MPAIPITKKGYDQLKLHLAEKKAEFELMPAIIGAARAKGDLRENAEYHSARERQGMLKAELDKLSGDLAGSQVIDPAILPPGLITFGKVVCLKDKASGSEVTYKILGPTESDASKNEISITSQFAKCILGKKVGEECHVKVPAGERYYTVVSISL